jgi:hypothetical protein
MELKPKPIYGGIRLAVFKNAMEIFTLLDKSNCRLCGEKTCLAFAGGVFLGTKVLSECPKIEQNVIDQFGAEPVAKHPVEELQEKEFKLLLQKAIDLDFEDSSSRIGAEVREGNLSFKVLGKQFGLSRDGRFITDLHIIPWMVMPLLDYVCHCKGESVRGDWISFREIPGGREQYGLFKKRGEDVLKALGDKYVDFFDDIVHMLDGREVAKQFESDVSVVLYPFPLVPIMLCYWQAEDGMESKFNLFFDSSVVENLGSGSAFFIGTGLAQMLDKLAAHHGF